MDEFNNHTNNEDSYYQLNNYSHHNENLYNNQYINYDYQPIKTYSTAPIILGILSFLGIFIPILGYALSIPGIVISSKEQLNPYSKYGNIGLKLCIIALIISIIVHLTNIIALSKILT